MDYSLLLIFFKKTYVTDDESNEVLAEEHKNMKMSIFIKKGDDGNFI